MTKPVIVTRAGKGSALSFAEGDANFTNLQNATVTVAGDSGTPQVLDLNDTLTIAGGTGLSSVASATDTLTLNLDNTAVTAGSYTKASITVDAQGRITAASNGSADFATADARTAISVTDAGGDGSLGYDNSTGVITYTGPSASDVRSHFSASTGIAITDGAISTTITQYTDTSARSALSVTDSGGDGSLSYNNSTGVITYVGPSASDTRAHFSGGTAISITNGVIAFTGTQANGNELENVIEDTTPQLGGELDGQGNTISNVNLKQYKETVYSLGSTDSPTLNYANGNVQQVSITSGLSLPAFTSVAAGQSITLIVTGSGTATGTASHKFAGGDTTLTSYSIVSIFYDGGTYWTSIATDFQ